MADHRMKGCACESCERRRAKVRAWAASPAGKAYHRAYKQTEGYKAQQRAYEATERGQAVTRAKKRRYDESPKGREAQRRQDAWRRSREADREKLAARKAVHKAKKAGKIVAPDVCQRCSGPGPLEAHHHLGYARERRLDVLFLCSPCHRIEERPA